MLEVKNRISLLLVLLVSRRSIDEAMTHRLVGLRPVVHLADITMRNILYSIEILVMSRNLDSAAPTACAIVIKAVRIRNRSAVDLKLVIVESLILRSRLTCPYTVLIPLQRILHSTEVKLYSGRIRSLELSAYNTL